MTWRMQLAAATVLLALTLAPATAQQPGSEVRTLTEREVPPAVTARLQCRAPQGPVARRVFSGGFVFEQPCDLRGESQTRLVFADTAEGGGARLLQFHRPEGRRLSALTNVAFTQAGSEISGHVGRLSRRICRAEGRWRMEGRKPAPSLMFWRQTRDCDGKTRWQVMVNRR